MGRLRRKIEADPKSPALIITVPGVGYKFTERPQKLSPVLERDFGRQEPRRAERRQLTVMLCSLAGLVTLAEDIDPEDLRALIDCYHACCAQVISSTGGMAAKYLNDTVLAWFGYPQAAEHSAERAIRAGLTLIEAVSRLDPRLHCRIGVATGLVVMGDLASDPFGTPSALGEAPDLATRLLARAGGDTMVISEGCQRLTRGIFEYKELPPLQEHGTLRLGRAFQVIGEAGIESRFDALHDQGLTPLVGREEELDLLLHRWLQAKDGEGQGVVLSGEAGIGKSRILSTLRERLEAQGVQTLCLQCSPYHVNSAFWPIIANLDHPPSRGHRLDRQISAGRRVHHRVVDQVGEHLRQQVSISKHPQVRRDLRVQRLRPLLGDRLIGLDQSAQQGAQRHRLEPRSPCPRFDLGDPQQRSSIPPIVVRNSTGVAMSLARKVRTTASPSRPGSIRSTISKVPRLRCCAQQTSAAAHPPATSRSCARSAVPRRRTPPFRDRPRSTRCASGCPHAGPCHSGRRLNVNLSIEKVLASLRQGGFRHVSRMHAFARPCQDVSPDRRRRPSTQAIWTNAAMSTWSRPA